jgi:hypothetical protein
MDYQNILLPIVGWWQAWQKMREIASQDSMIPLARRMEAERRVSVREIIAYPGDQGFNAAIQ